MHNFFVTIQSAGSKSDDSSVCRLIIPNILMIRIQNWMRFDTSFEPNGYRCSGRFGNVVVRYLANTMPQKEKLL